MTMLLFVCHRAIPLDMVRFVHCGYSVAIRSGDPIPVCRDCAGRLTPVIPTDPPPVKAKA